MQQKPIIEVFNSSGQIIDIIKPGSSNIANWNASIKNTGVYYYRVKTTKAIKTKAISTAIIACLKKDSPKEGPMLSTFIELTS